VHFGCLGSVVFLIEAVKTLNAAPWLWPLRQQE
jgi:hypothetical protein